MPSTRRSTGSDDLTRRLADRAGAWLLPYWMERQLDPEGPDLVSGAPGSPVVNATHRERSPVGTLGSARVATVDPRGLVTPWRAGWSLDWWVGADDRWHLPSREVAVRQSTVDAAPVVETAMRVPGGDVVQRVWAFHDPAVGDVLAVEVENATRVPVALAVAVRPFGPDGAAPVERLVVRGRDVLVDGRRAVWLPREAARTAVIADADGDVADVVLSGAAADATDGEVTCPHGLAQAAMVFPLAHTATLRLLVPLDPDVDVSVPAPTTVPPVDAVTRGWLSHTGRAARAELADPTWAETLAAARSQVLLAAAGRDLAQGSTVATAAIVRALDRFGLHDEADTIVATSPRGQGTGGQLGGADPSAAATGAVLHAAGAHWSAGRERTLVEEIAGPLAAGAHHRPGAGRLGRRRAEPLEPWAAAWQRQGALEVADALAGAGQDAAADEIRRRDDLDEVALSALRGDVVADAATDPLPLLDLVVPLGLVGAGAEEVTRLLERIRSRHLHDDVVLRRHGAVALSPERTARLGQVELRRGDPAAWGRVRRLVELAGATRSWPELVHPRTGGGSGGDGWSPVAAAAFCELVADLFAYVEDGIVVLCPVLPDEWLGAGFEVHGLVTSVATVSYAVRWHGERPALLWEVVPHDDAGGPVRLLAPGLDPAWSTEDVRGEALLSRPPSAPVVGPDADASTDPEPSPAGGPDPVAPPTSEPPPRSEPPPSEGQSFG